MSSNRISLPASARIQGPRNTQLVGAIRLLRRFGRSIWQALEDSGQRRAARELLAIAERMQTSDPVLARRLRDAATFGPRG
ncbi:MAG: hypothetical protein WA210_06070 [Burkholderiaceae bacterium]